MPLARISPANPLRSGLVQLAGYLVKEGAHQPEHPRQIDNDVHKCYRGSISDKPQLAHDQEQRQRQNTQHALTWTPYAECRTSVV